MKGWGGPEAGTMAEGLKRRPPMEVGGLSLEFRV